MLSRMKYWFWAFKTSNPFLLEYSFYNPFSKIMVFILNIFHYVLAFIIDISSFQNGLNHPFSSTSSYC